VADMMASRWAYEALAVYQFKENSYEKPYYSFEKIEAQADFRSSFLIDELDKKRRDIAGNLDEKADSIRQKLQSDLTIIETTLRKDYFRKGLEKELAADWTLKDFTPAFNKKLEDFFIAYKKFYQEAYNKAVAARENVILQLEKNPDYKLNDYKNDYYNESLADLVKNVNEKNRIIEFNGELIQQVNPVFLPPAPKSPVDYRAQFFAPEKQFLGISFSTYLFDLLVIWAMAAILYVTLYFELLRKFIESFDKIQGQLALAKAKKK